MQADNEYTMESEVEDAPELDPSGRVKSSRHYYEDGDLELVSSDNFIFKIHAYYLQGSSKVFRDMIEVASRNSSDPIELVDSEFEDAATVNDVLDDIVDHKANIASRPLRCVKNMLSFFQKYECQRELQNAKGQLSSELLETEESAFRVFVLAALLKELELCGRAISLGWDLRPYEGLFDLRYTDRRTLGILSTDCLWALMRASIHPGWGPEEEWGGKEVAAEYISLMLDAEMSEDEEASDYDSAA